MEIVQHKYGSEPFWNLSFDGSSGKVDSGEGVWVCNTKNNHAKGHSYKLNFQYTKNIAEYEALLIMIMMIFR